MFTWFKQHKAALIMQFSALALAGVCIASLGCQPEKIVPFNLPEDMATDLAIPPKTTFYEAGYNAKEWEARSLRTQERYNDEYEYKSTWVGGLYGLQEAGKELLLSQAGALGGVGTLLIGLAFGGGLMTRRPGDERKKK